MPINIEKEVKQVSSTPVVDGVVQTSTAAEVPTEGEMKDAKADRGNAWIWYIVGIVDLLLLLRFAFYLFGARAVGFADMLYSITSPFVMPFRGIFPNTQVDGSFFDTASIVAIIAYALLGWAVLGLVDLVTRPATSKKV